MIVQFTKSNTEKIIFSDVSPEDALRYIPGVEMAIEANIAHHKGIEPIPEPEAAMRPAKREGTVFEAGMLALLFALLAHNSDYSGNWFGYTIAAIWFFVAVFRAVNWGR